MKARMRLMMLAATLMMAVGCMAQETTPVVETKSGKVQGIIQEGTMAFLGIPYATVERCMPPQPVKAWKDVRQLGHKSNLPSSNP